VNEAGGEGILGTNRFARSAKTDGTEILVGTASTVVPWVLGRSAVKYSFEDLKPVVVNGTGGVIYARAEAGVAGVQDLINRDQPLEFGGISATGLDITTLVAFDLLEADVTSTFGFEGRGPVNLALQRGEIDLDYQTTSAYGSAVAGIVKEGKAVVLMSFGQLNEAGDVIRDPNFPDVPTVAEAYETLHGKKPSGEKYEAYKTLLGLTYTYQKGLWVPQETPESAYELLRQSSEKLGADAGFQEKAAKVLGGYPLVADPGTADRVRDAYKVSGSVRSYVTGLLADKYNIHVE
jgi:tripartite-type tricarboxylate transporter receptor subunit TctC